MNFHDLMKVARATPEERDKCAWFLAMFRAKRVYEELKSEPVLIKIEPFTPEEQSYIDGMQSTPAPYDRETIVGPTPRVMGREF